MVITYDVTKDIRFKQGKAIGIEKGIKQGVKEAKESIIRKLFLIRELSIHDVAQITDTPVSC